MRLPATRRGQLLLALIVVLFAVIGGVVAGRNLFAPSAAIRATATLADRNGTLQARYHTGPPKGHPVVVFLGPFSIRKHKGWHQCGPAVRLMEGALKRKRIRHTPPRNCVGPATVKQIRIFQRHSKIPPSGIYGLRTHLALVKANGYTAQGRRDLVYLAHKIYVGKVRRNILVITSHARLVGGNTLAYSQSGSRSYFPSWPRLPPATDCSGFVTWVFWQAGIGASVGYFGPGSSVGWTGTLGNQGILVRTNQPLAIGDLVLYPSSSAGGYPWGHVEVYIGHGLTEGHGSVGIHVHVYNYRPVGQVRRYFG